MKGVLANNKQNVQTSNMQADMARSRVNNSTVQKIAAMKSSFLNSSLAKHEGLIKRRMDYLKSVTDSLGDQDTIEVEVSKRMEENRSALKKKNESSMALETHLQTMRAQGTSLTADNKEPTFSVDSRNLDNEHHNEYFQLNN